MQYFYYVYLVTCTQNYNPVHVFPLIHVESTHESTNEIQLLQKIFSAWFEYFEYIPYLLYSRIMNIPS